MTKVGFIGLGSQGAPMARRIADAGFELTVWARRPETVAEFGAVSSVADDPVGLAAAVDVVCLCVLADKDVLEVGETVFHGLRPGTILVVHSTVHPDTVRTLAEEGTARDIAVLDAPVSGGGPAAAAGELVTIVGGDAAALDACRPVLATHSNQIIHIGGVGAGQLAKILNNGLFYAQAGLGQAAFELADQWQLDREALGTFIASGSGRSFAVGIAKMLSRPTDFGGLLPKDIGLLESLAGDNPAGRAVAAAARRLQESPTG
jgi:3-hydroxyisobutyrate dehydrogenase